MPFLLVKMTGKDSRSEPGPHKMWVRLDGFALGWEEAERRADDVPDGTLMESLHGRGAGFWVLARFFVCFLLLRFHAMLQVRFPFLFLSLPDFLGDCCGLLGGEGGGVDEKMGMHGPPPRNQSVRVGWSGISEEKECLTAGKYVLYQRHHFVGMEIWSDVYIVRPMWGTLKAGIQRIWEMCPLRRCIGPKSPYSSRTMTLTKPQATGVAARKP